MLKTLLAERFKLILHTETRRLPLYALVTARTDDSMGKQIRRSGPECTPPTFPGSAADGPPPPPAPPPPPPGAGTPLGVGPALRCPSIFFPGHISARDVTMGSLAIRLSQTLRRPVIDRTGLTGGFDLDLTYTPEPQGPAIAPTDSGPSIFTAFPEQLGLKLESERGLVEVLVIDRAEKPTVE